MAILTVYRVALIRNNQEVKGIVIGKKEYKIKQFADDSQTMSIFEIDSINATIKNFP